MTTRTATLNIRHGGRKFGDALAVTEFHDNDVGACLMSRLASAVSGKPEAATLRNPPAGRRRADLRGRLGRAFGDRWEADDETADDRPQVGIIRHGDGR